MARRQLAASATCEYQSGDHPRPSPPEAPEGHAPIKPLPRPARQSRMSLLGGAHEPQRAHSMNAELRQYGPDRPRPEPRPDVRENEKNLGNMVNDFNFNQAPQAPVLLPTNPPTDSPSIPASFTGKGLASDARPRHPAPEIHRCPVVRGEWAADGGWSHRPQTDPAHKPTVGNGDQRWSSKTVGYGLDLRELAGGGSAPFTVRNVEVGGSSPLTSTKSPYSVL